MSVDCSDFANLDAGWKRNRCIIDNFNQEYERNNKRMALLNQQYSKKYKAQKTMLIHISIALVIIIILTGIGKLTGTESYTKYPIILISVLISLKTAYDLFDYVFRSNQNFDEYDFKINLPTPSSAESFKGSKTLEPFLSEYCSELSPESVENSDLKVLYGSRRRCFTASYPEDNQHIQEYANCYDSSNNEESCKSFLDNIWSNDYKYNNVSWFDNMRKTFASTFVTSSNQWNSNTNISSYCSSVCNANDEKSKTDCGVLCKGGSEGPFADLFTDETDAIACTGTSTLYGTEFDGKTTDDVLNKQSWYNTDTYGSRTWTESQENNQEDNPKKPSLYANITQWTKNRNRSNALENCKLRCSYDMYDCLDGNVDAPNMLMSINNIKDKCNEKCSFKIPNHDLPVLVQDANISSPDTPPDFDNADYNFPLDEFAPHITASNWSDYRKNY
jgi:hypothetical protein